jgi:hypothetical protein
MRQWRRKNVRQIPNRRESKSREGRKTVAGAEECGTGAGKDLEEEKGHNTTLNSAQQSNIMQWR